MAKLLEIEGLRVEFRTHAGRIKAVDGISYGVGEGETVAVVGESGLKISTGNLQAWLRAAFYVVTIAAALAVGNLIGG